MLNVKSESKFRYKNKKNDRSYPVFLDTPCRFLDISVFFFILFCWEETKELGIDEVGYLAEILGILSKL